MSETDNQTAFGPDRWLTAKQVGEKYNVPTSTIYSWAWRGLIRSHKIFGVLRFIYKEVVEDLEADAR